MMSQGRARPITPGTHPAHISSIKHDVKRPGLFVTIVNSRFGFNDSVPKYDSWSDLNYNQEVSTWLRLVENTKHDILHGENLTPLRPTEPFRNSQLYFDDFLDEVEKKIRESKPSFLFFYIASHGDDQGNFLLSAHSDSTTMCKDANCYGRHKRCGGCHKRNIDEIQRKLQGILCMEGKPKIFINQLCRGTKVDGGRAHVLDEVDIAPRIGNNKPVIYMIPEGDTIVLNATISGHKSYVQGGRAWILERLEKEIRELQNLSDNDLMKLKEQVTNLREKFPNACYEQTIESLVGGWLLDVFDRVVRVVGLTKEIKYADTGENCDKQLPELISTMTRRVSAIDMFR